MKNNKTTANVAPATTAPAAEKKTKPAAKKTSKATKPAAKKTAKDVPPVHGYDQQKRVFILVNPITKTDEDGNYSAELRTITIKAPQTKSGDLLIVEDNAQEFATMIESALLEIIDGGAREQIASIAQKVEKRDVKERTPREEKEYQKWVMLRKLVSATRTRLKTRDAAKDDLAEMLARLALAKMLVLELGRLKHALDDMSAMLNEKLSKLVAGESVALTDMEQERVTECKHIVADIAGRYLKETKWFKGFKLKVSNRDIVDFYKLGFSGLDRKYNVVDAYKQERGKTLETYLPRYFMRKVGCDDAE